MPSPSRLAAAAIAVALTLAATTARAAEKVTISIPVMNSNFGYLLIAQDKGYFREEGIEPEFVAMSGGRATPALIGGSLDYTSSASSAISAILRGAKLKVVFVSARRITQRLWSFDPAIRTFEDMKGKLIAVASRGGSEEIAIRMLLKEKGLPSNFVGFADMGVGVQRVAAIKSGGQQLATLGRVEEGQLRQAGMLDKARVVVDLAENIDLSNGGLATGEAELADRRDRTEKVLRAAWKGVLFMLADREATIEAMHRRFPSLARDNLEHDVDGAIEDLNRDGVLPPESIEREIATRAELLGVAAEAVPPPARVYDFSVFDKVKAELAGWKPAR